MEIIDVVIDRLSEQLGASLSAKRKWATGGFRNPGNVNNKLLTTSINDFLSTQKR